MPVRLAFGALAIALGAFSLALARSDPGFSFARTSALGGLALLGAGCGLVVAGLVFWARRPSNAAGPLLALAGVGWFAAEWDTPGAGAVVFTLGLLLYAACPALVGWATLAYPAGRLTSLPQRVAVASALAGAVLVLGLLPALAFDPAGGGCSDCPRNLLAATDQPDAVDALTRAGVHLGLAWSLLLIALTAWGLVRASPARRRLLAPVAVAGSVYLGLVAWSYAASLDRGFVGSGDLQRQLWLAQAAALAALAVAVLWSLVRARRTRGRVVRLVVELGEVARAGSLAEALAQLVGDPELEVAYPIGDGRFVDAAGRPVDVPGDAGRRTTPLVREGRTVAVLIHRPGLLDDQELVEELVSTARLALDNERLEAEARAQIADLRASRARIVETGDAERRRLERDLHDGAQQRLIGLSLALRVLRAQLGADVDASVASRLDTAQAELGTAVAELRDLARGLHPTVLSDEGLGAALEALAEGAAAAVTVACAPDERFPPAVETAAYLVAAEATRAGPASVRAVRHDGALVVEIDADTPPASLLELEDRVGAVDGVLVLAPGPSGGVTIRAEIPCGS